MNSNKTKICKTKEKPQDEENKNDPDKNQMI